MPDIPVVVLGAGGVGKSCLTIQYVQGHFVDKYDATIEDVYRKPIDLDGVPEVLTVVDTAGQDTFGAMREQYMRKGNGFVLVYSITDTESFVQIQKIYTQLRRIRGAMRSSPCVLVANKIDQETYRAVDRETGRQLAAEVMRCPFLEVTAKDHKMAEEVFDVLVRTIRHGSATLARAQPSVSAQAQSMGTGLASTPNTTDASTSKEPRRLVADSPVLGEGTDNLNAVDSGTANQSADPIKSTSKRKKKRRCTLL